MKNKESIVQYFSKIIANLRIHGEKMEGDWMHDVCHQKSSTLLPSRKCTGRQQIIPSHKRERVGFLGIPRATIIFSQVHYLIYQTIVIIQLENKKTNKEAKGHHAT